MVGQCGPKVHIDPPLSINPNSVGDLPKRIEPFRMVEGEAIARLSGFGVFQCWENAPPQNPNVLPIPMVAS